MDNIVVPCFFDSQFMENSRSQL